MFLVLPLLAAVAAIVVALPAGECLSCPVRGSGNYK